MPAVLDCPPRESSEFDAPTVAPRHVLVVDDDPSVRITLSAILNQRGYEVTCADSGSQAIEQFCQQGADLVILDIRMPDMYGFEVCRHIKQHSIVPVVFLSGAREESDDELSKIVNDAGADLWLHKPLNVYHIMRTLDSLLS